jgi:hypothetical protein
MSDGELARQFQRACRLLGWLMLAQTVLVVTALIGWMLWVASGDRRFDSSKLLPQSLVVITVGGLLTGLCIGIFKKHRWALVVVAMMAGLTLAGSVFGLVVGIMYQQPGYAVSVIGLIISSAMVVLGRDASRLAKQVRKIG